MSREALSSLLPLAVAIPLLGAVIAPLVARISRRLPPVVAVMALLSSGVLLLLMAPTVYGGQLLSHFMGHWNPVRRPCPRHRLRRRSVGLDLRPADRFPRGRPGRLSLVGAGDLGRRELGGYTCLFLLLCAALIGSALTADLFNLFVWFEVAALSSYALTAFFLERPIALEAAFKILVLTTIASFAHLHRGRLDLRRSRRSQPRADLTMRSTSTARPADSGRAWLSSSRDFGTKAGLVPFHGWLPDAHTAAPGPVSALFSGLMVNLGIVAIGRIVFEVYTPRHRPRPLGLLMVIGLVSAVAGAFFALFQDDLKRLLAYDTISQMGVLVVGLATGTAAGFAGASYHLVDHALFKALLFLCAGSIVHMTGATKLSEMGGLARRYPLLAAAFTVGVLAIAGIPPLNGYVSLGLIHDALRQSGQGVPFAVMLMAQVLTIAALGKAAWLAFYRRRDPDAEFERDEKLHPTMVVSLGLLAAGCVAFGTFPTVLIGDFAAPAAGALLAPGGLRPRGARFRWAALHGCRLLRLCEPIGLLTALGTVLVGFPGGGARDALERVAAGGGHPPGAERFGQRLCELPGGRVDRGRPRFYPRRVGLGRLMRIGEPSAARPVDGAARPRSSGGRDHRPWCRPLGRNRP